MKKVEHKKLHIDLRQQENSSFTAIQKLFENFLKNWELRPDRGGVIRSKVRTVMVSEQSNTPHHRANYHVESSFSEQEMPFIIRCNTLLAKLVSGKTEKSALSQKVITNFKAQSGEKSFTSALSQGLLTSLEEFGELYPTLLPALNVMFKVAGSEGLDLAVRHSANLLFKAINSSTPLASPATKVGVTNFTGIHPADISKPLEYEIWCSGMMFALEIMNQATTAAQTLSTMHLSQEEKTHIIRELLQCKSIEQPSRELVENMYQRELAKQRRTPLE